MVDKLISFIYKKVNGWWVLGSFIAHHLFNTYILVPQIRKVRNLETGANILDGLRSNYSVEMVYKQFELYGNVGREAYAGFIALDMLYPLVYGLMLLALISWPMKHAVKEDNKLRWISLFPILLVLTDYFENIGHIILLNNYPIQLMTYAGINAYISHFKWNLAYLNIFLFVFSLSIFVGMKINKLIGNQRNNIK